MTALNGFPFATTAGQGLFNGASSNGYIQGQAFADPATRNALRAGVVSGSETVPMWGGIAVNALIAPVTAGGTSNVLGQSLARSTSLSTLVGFTVFDQAYNMLNSPGSPVPTAGSGQSINYYPLGSRARVALACSSNLVDLYGHAINSQVSWDFTNNQLIPYSGAYTQTAISAASWAATGGGRIDFTVGADLTTYINAGDWIDTAGIVETGGTGGSLNGFFEVYSISATHIVVVAPAAAGYYATYTSGGHVSAGGGALPVTVLDVQSSGCMVVDPTTGQFVWNYDGACALVQLTGGTVA